MKRDLVQYEHMNVVGHIKTLAGASQVFVGLMRPVKDRPITELSLMEASQDQYLTRHLPDGRIIYTDHRISTIAGYMPSEVNGKSAFNFFYAEDLPWTTMAMRNSTKSGYQTVITIPTLTNCSVRQFQWRGQHCLQVTINASFCVLSKIEIEPSENL